MFEQDSMKFKWNLYPALIDTVVKNCIDPNETFELNNELYLELSFSSNRIILTNSSKANSKSTKYGLDVLTMSDMFAIP